MILAPSSHMTKHFLRLGVLVLCVATMVAAQASAPLSQSDIDRLLSGGVSPARVATLVEQRGVDFDPDQNYLRSLELRDESGTLGDAVRAAGQKRALPHAEADLKAGHWAQAEQEYRAAIALDPNSAAAHAGLGTALVEQGRGEAAIPELGQALARDPNNAAAHRGMGMALAQRKDYPGALTELSRAKQLNPNDPLTHSAIGDVMLEQGDADGAMAEFTQAQTLDSNLQSARIGMARSFERKGDLSGAENNYRYLLALDSKNPPANYGMGGLMEKKRNNQEALNFYRVAYTSDPSNPKYRDAYERVVALTVNANVTVNINPPVTVAAQPTGTGFIHVYRKSRFVASLATWNIGVDDKQVAKIGNGRHFTVKVPAGKHMVYSELGRTPLAIDVQPNRQYYVEVELISEFFSAYVAVKLTPPTTGENDFTHTRPIEPERIYDHELVVDDAAGGTTPQREKQEKEEMMMKKKRGK